MSDDLNDLLQEDVLQHDIEHSEQNTEMALLNAEPLQDAESNDKPARSDFLYASRYSLTVQKPYCLATAYGL